MYNLVIFLVTELSYDRLVSGLTKHNIQVGGSFIKGQTIIKSASCGVGLRLTPHKKNDDLSAFSEFIESFLKENKISFYGYTLLKEVVGGFSAMRVHAGWFNPIEEPPVKEHNTSTPYRD